jgi:branched-chain amino acid transport system substrate-binding protein
VSKKEGKKSYKTFFKGGGEMKKKILLMILTIGILTSFLLTSALTAADAAAPEKPAAAPAKPAVAAKPIIIGVPTSLYTPFGRDGLKAVNLAVEEINAKGGVLVGKERRLFKVVVTDTRDGEPGTPIHDSLMAYEKMILEQKPHAVVIAPFRSEAIIASMDLVAKYKIPQIHTIAQTPAFQRQFKTDPEKYKYLFRATTDATVPGMYISRALDLLKKDFKLENLYILYQDTLWAKAFADVVRKHGQETGWKEVGYDAYAAGASDFSPGLTKAKEGKAQVIAMMWDVPLGAGIFAKQYVAMQVPALLVGFIPPMGSPAAVKAVGQEVEYSITVEFPVGASLALKKLPKTVEFLDKFKKKYKDLPEPPAVNSSAYDAVFILAQAIERAGTLDADKLVVALEQTDYKGVSGRIRFNKEQHTAIFGDKDPNETGVAVVFQWQKDKTGTLIRVPIYPDFVAEGKVLLPPWMK